MNTNSKLKFSILMLATILLQSCASLYPTTAGYEQILNSWSGSDVNKLMLSWGPPADVFTMPNGNKMYTWLYVGNSYVSSNYNYYLNQIQTTGFTQYCKTTFTTNSSDRIVSWRYKGNVCRAYIKK